MKRVAPSILPAVLLMALTLALGVGGARADFELLLKDGQLLSGIDVERKDGQYLLELTAGRILSIPYELVAEVRITAGSARGVRKAVPEQLAGDEIPLEGDARAASGMNRTDPEVLAGDPFEPPSRAEQLEELGEPSRFADSVVDHDWRPGSDWDYTDVTEFNPSTWANGLNNRWRPSSDYTDRTDVTEFSPARWARGLPPATWQPEDGFKKKKSDWQRAAAGSGEARLGATTPAARSVPTGTSVTTCSWCSKFTLAPTRSARRLTGSIPRPASRPSGTDVRSCAEEIFEPLLARGASSPTELKQRQDRLVVRWIEDEAFSGLPLRLYEGSWTDSEGPGRRAVFSYADGSCRLINGDLDDLLGVEVSGEQVGSYATTAFNAALDPTRPVQLDSDLEKIEYALAVSSLLLPGTTEMRILEAGEQLAVEREQQCASPKRLRRKEARRLRDEFESPRIDRGAAAEVVQFYSWDRLGGIVRSHRVLLSPSGEVSMEIVDVAAHLGEHVCE